MSKSIAYLAALFLTTAFSAGNCFSQEIDLAADKIPDSLIKNATAVVRYEKEIFEVTDIDRASHKVHNITTILNERGRGHLVFQSFSDKFMKLGDVSIKVYDANGKLINKYKKKDLSTFNIGEGLIDDGIRNYFIVSAASYPITIETEYDMTFRGILVYPAYHFSYPDLAVMNSSYTAIVPKANGLRYKAKNTSIVPDKGDDGKTESFTWSVKNQPAITYEDGSVGSGKSYPYILLAPNKFKLDDFEGDLSSWKNFGLWYSSLLKGTDKLTETQVKFYKDLVKDAGTNREKIKIVYDYMQKNFRYVSIQLGIGGQKPLPASFTDDKKYGDCKGLSNYMYSVLKTLGIKSYVALINRQSNDEGVDPDFPADRFNHLILFVPDGKDSIWLECTSKTALFGMLDNSTENRNAVLITEDGGVLVATPESEAANNTFTVRTTINLDENGSGNCLSNIQATGEYKEDFLRYLSDSKKDDQKEYLVKGIGYKQPDDMLITRIADPATYHTNIELAIEKVSEFMAGSKMFLAPHIYKFWSYKMPENEKRQRDYYFEVPFRKSDTTIYMMPEGFVIDLLPAGNKFSCETAEYSSSYFYKENEKAIYSITRLELKKHIIPPARYQEIKQFFDKVLKEEAQRIVIKKDPNQQQPPPRKAGF
jgi:hypothetical protein